MAAEEETKASERRESKDDLGDRMKAYEADAQDCRKLDPEKPIMARIDGHKFSTFTRGRLSTSM